jgi:rhodanese-related sulfurtransferase
MAIARISPAEAARLMEGEGYTYLDVRTPAEFEAGRPRGAVNVPWLVPGPAGLAPNASFLDGVRASFAHDAPLVVGCRSGQRSQGASAALEAAGFTRVVEQRAGFEGARGPFGQVVEPGWLALGLPSEAGK